MSTLQGYFEKRGHKAAWLSLLALAIWGWMLLATPRQSTLPSSTPPNLRRVDESGRRQEQRQAREQRKAALAKHHKARVMASRSGGDTCEKNVEHLGKALDSYRFDHATYPTGLNQLVPDYIDHLPTCSKLGKETYSAGYQVSPYGYHCELCCLECRNAGDSEKYESTTGMDYGYEAP